MKFSQFKAMEIAYRIISKFNSDLHSEDRKWLFGLEWSEDGTDTLSEESLRALEAIENWLLKSHNWISSYISEVDDKSAKGGKR